MMDAGPIAIELGTGADAFRPLPEGSDLEVVHGPQGGWHVELSARLGGLDPDGGLLRFQIVDDGGVLVAETRIAVYARRLDRDGCAYLRHGDIVVLSLPDPPEVLGEDVTARVILEIGGESVAEDERGVHLVDDVIP